MAHPVRLAGESAYQGRARVFITASTFQRNPAFADRAVAEQTTAELLRVAIFGHVEVTVFCVMPEHVHLLLAGLTEDSHIPTTVRRLKQRTGYWYRRRTVGASGKATIGTGFCDSVITLGLFSRTSFRILFDPAWLQTWRLTSCSAQAGFIAPSCCRSAWPG